MPLNRAILLLALALVPAAAFAQTGQSPSIVLPTVIVTAQKDASEIKEVPASVTAVTSTTISDSGLLSITDAGFFAPNTVFTEFTARKVSNARFRGIGSSPANPAVTTYIDGVPRLNSNASNIELLDVSQIEFVRGPQSPLFGRNTLGGIVNVTSAKPSMAAWTGGVNMPIGTNGLWDVRGNVSGPINDKVGVSFAAGKQARDGFTTNTITGNSLDTRDGTFAKAQVRLVNRNWESRVIYSYERNRDGDYALGDLAAIRATPFQVARDFEGFTNRDINSTTFYGRGSGQNFAIETTTGFVKWNTEDRTDLDYSPLPLAIRNNAEEGSQFTQQIRLSSPENAPLALGSTMLKWQAGFEFFDHEYNQEAVNELSAFVLSPQINFPVAMHSPDAAIDTTGIGLFGHATITVKEKADIVAGLRFDHESSDAHLDTFTSPAITPPNVVVAEDSFSDVSPQFAFAYRATPEQTAYASVSRGYKAGGFNPAAIPGHEAYGEEHAWHLEGGWKASLAGGKVAANASLFFINWDDLQLNIPNRFVPGQFYIYNAGKAHSRGVEAELMARPRADLDIFGSFGITAARFGEGSESNGAAINDNRVPYTPEYTAMFGGQMTRAINSSVNGFGRVEVALTGKFQYDENNTQGQDAFSIVNLRAGARHKRLFAELWLRNAFDTAYVPIAIPYPGFAPSGFIGENGRPRTFGVSIGATF